MYVGLGKSGACKAHRLACVLVNFAHRRTQSSTTSFVNSMYVIHISRLKNKTHALTDVAVAYDACIKAAIKPKSWTAILELFVLVSSEFLTQPWINLAPVP